MTINRHKGDAAKITQWLRLSRPAVDGGVLGIKIGSKVMKFEAWDVTDMVSKLNGRTDPIDLVSDSGEFQDVEFTAGTDVIECKSRTPGEPFDLTTYLGGDSFLNEIEKITMTNDPTGGTYTLTFEGQTTGNIAYDASAGTIQTALEALSNIIPGDVAVTGSFPEYFVEFMGTFQGVNVDSMTTNKANLTGGDCNVVVTAGADGAVPINEVQTIAYDGTPDGGTFTLTYNGQTTGNIAWNASAATVQTALRALSTINGANVTCIGGALPTLITCTFGGTLAGQNVSQITGNGTNLTTSHSLTYTYSEPKAAIAGVNQKINVKWNTTDSHYASWSGVGRILMGAADTSSSGVSLSVDLKNATNAQWVDYFNHIFNEDVNPTPFWGSDNLIVTGTPQDPSGMTIEGINGLKYSPIQIDFDAFTGPQYTGIVRITYIQTSANGQNEQQKFLFTVDRTVDMFFNFDGVTVGPWSTTTTIGQMISDLRAAYINKNDCRLYGDTSLVIADFHDAAGGGGQNIALSGSYLTIEYAKKGYQGTDVATATFTAAPTGGFHVISATTTDGFVGTNELQVVSFQSVQAVFGGTFTLTQNGHTTGNLAWDASAAVIQAAIEVLTGIGAGNVNCAGSLPSGMTCIFAKSLGNLALMTGTSTLNCSDAVVTTTQGGVPYTPIGITVIAESEGPEHFDTAENWTLDRIPHWGDNIVIDSGSVSVKFGIKQSITFEFVRYSLSHSQFITGIGRRVHRDGQKVRVRATSGALPTGLAANTDYLIAQSDWFGNFELTDTGGTTIACSDAGSGSWVVEIFLDVDGLQSWNGGLGLPDLNEDNQESYVEYRPTKLECQLGAVNVGEGAGAGPTRFRVKATARLLTMTVHNNGARTAEGDPGITVETEDFGNVLNLFKGSVGLAQKSDQFAWIKTLRVGYVDNVTSDVTLIVGPNVIIDIGEWIEVSGGTIYAQSLLPKLRMVDGEIHSLEGGITTFEADKGTIYYASAETCTTAKIGSGCSVNFTKDMRPREFTNIFLYENSEFHDPFGTVIIPNGYNLVRCGENDCVIELPSNVNIVRTPL